MRSGTVVGPTVADRLLGEARADRIMRDSRAGTLDGGTGRDILDGPRGDDRLHKVGCQRPFTGLRTLGCRNVAFNPLAC